MLGVHTTAADPELGINGCVGETKKGGEGLGGEWKYLPTKNWINAHKMTCVNC